MDNDSFVLLVVIIHQIDKGLDLRFGWNSIVRNVDVIVGKLTRHILAIIELAAIDDSPDIFLFVDFKHIRIGPPRRRDDSIYNPSERLRAFRLSFLRPIPGANGVGHNF